MITLLLPKSLLRLAGRAYENPRYEKTAQLMFKKAEKLPYILCIAMQSTIMEDIEGELKWDGTLNKFSKQLGNMAIGNFRAGRTQT